MVNALQQKLVNLDWQLIIDELIIKGYAGIKNVLDDQQCEKLKAEYLNQSLYRKTVNMQQYRFGQGEYKYYNYPLPPLVQTIRETVYPKLVPVANSWMSLLNQKAIFPAELEQLKQQCEQASQCLATPLILKYQQGGFNTLHQDLYGSVYFPFQLVINLSQPGTDYQGGELVLTQQIPRAQSQAKVLQPEKGDMIIFATNFRPQQGNRGYYRVVMKHGVSEVTQGSRYALGVIFHDAQQ